VNFDDQEAMQDFNNKAIVTFEQAIQHSPNDPLLWNQIGVFYLRQEHYVSAKEAFETAIQLNSQYLNAWSNLGKSIGPWSQNQNYRIYFAMKLSESLTKLFDIQR
jgi:cytochrome c-type biogenesis protein CcmH/NrfG